jgi:hypothetical protein
MDEIERLKVLAGIKQEQLYTEYKVPDNISHTSQEKADFQKDKKIKPGDPAWFRLWFARPKLTGENPFGK